MSFLNPFILFGLALASVPIIIHLLYRRRFQQVDWAPMKYLKLTIRSNRRRLRLEQLLLLLLRTAMVALLVLAVARPTVDATGVGAWLGGGSRVSRVVVLDDSLSMGYRGDGPATFDRALDATRDLLDSYGSQDSVTLLTTSSPDNPLLRDAHLEDDTSITESIASIKVSHTASDWPRTFKTVEQYLESATFPIREITLVTDLRRHGWNAEVTKLVEPWASEQVTVKVVNVGEVGVDNASLVSLEREDPIALINTPVKLRAKIRNATPTVMPSAQAVLTVDEESTTVVLPDLAPGSTTEVPLSVTLREAGQHRVRLTIPGDRLNEDNTRWLTLDVRDRLNIVLVDGEPSGEPFQSETDFLMLAFSVGRVPWHVTRVIDAEWLGNRFDPPDVLVLANVADVGVKRKRLHQLVRDGMGLMIFPGDVTDPEAYNRAFGAGETELLPGTLGFPLDEPVTGLLVEPLSDSPLTVLSRLAPEALARTEARRLLAVDVPEQLETVRVLARWNDAQQRPAVLERRVGDGRVVLWTVTADKHWSDWPIDPTYVLAAREAALSVARRSDATSGAIAGQPLVIRLHEDDAPTDARVTAPNAEAPAAASIGEQDGRSIMRFTDTARAGIYAANWTTPTGAEQTRWVDVNADPAESELDTIDRNTLLDLFGSVKAGVLDYTGSAVSLSGRGREIWRTLVMAMLVMLAVESMLAWWVGRER